MTWPTISSYPQVQAHYEKCRAAGTSHSLAEMFALGEAPAINTDSTFMSGRHNDAGFKGHDDIAEGYKRQAEAAGVSVNGKVYMAGLAAYPGDPEAWIEGKADVKRVCEKRGWSAKGSVNVAVKEQEPTPEVSVADDIIDREVKEIVASVPNSACVDVVDLKEQVISKRKPHWAK